MAICNEWYVEVAIALYDECSQLDCVIFLLLGSRGQFGYYSWGLQETQFGRLKRPVLVQCHSASPFLNISKGEDMATHWVSYNGR